MSPSVNRSSESPQPPANSQEAGSKKTTKRTKSSSPPPSEASNSEATPAPDSTNAEAVPENSEATPAPDSTSAEAVPENSEPKTPRSQPIPPASEPMQYRAIGLVRAQYLPSAEQFTQGTLLADDHTIIDAVLLGRVMSLVKNHLNLSESHLWVVYPRVRKEDEKLHLQIVGVWEPENLNQGSSPDASKSSTTEEETEVIPVTDGYFSVRGEVIYQAREENHVIVKMRQSPRKPSEKLKFFKLKLQGSFEDKMVGHFWEFHVQREGDTLVIQGGKDIGEVRSKKGKKPFNKKSGKSGKGQNKSTSSQEAGAQPTAEAPAKRSGNLPKPAKRQQPPQS